MYRLRLCLSVLLCALLARPAYAATEPTKPPEPNAALLYWVAFAARNSTEAQEKILGDWKTVPFDDATMQVLDVGANSLRYLHHGAAIAHCDWGLAMEEGPKMLLPHLVRARDLGRLAALRARYDLEHARPDAAVDDITDLFTLARHAGSDSLLISILVQYSIEAMAVDVTADHLLSLDKEARTKLAARLSSLPAGGRIPDSQRSERQLLGDLIKALKEADPDTDWVEKVFIATNIMPADQARSIVAAAGGTPQAMLKCVDDLAPLYKELPAVLALPPDQFQARFDALKKQYDANPIAKLFLPSFNKAYNVGARAEARFAMLQAAIAVSLGGPEKLKEFSDPAGRGQFEYRALPDGYELQSAVMYEKQPVVLRVR